jgi:tRNA modification GTPase
MIHFSDSSPIIACSTGTGNNSAIAKIRIGGIQDLKMLDHLFSRKVSSFTPNKVYLVNIIDGGKVLDEAVAIFFKAPNSYNGENILELDVHGNLANVQRIIDFFIAQGICRLSGPGEFTYRALLNRKMSLTQVEGLEVLLNANSGSVFEQGLSTLRGELHDKYLTLRDSFVKLKASLELFIDFSDDVGPEVALNELNKSFSKFHLLLNSLFERTRLNCDSLMNPSVVLLGQTNAGKSSLFNGMLYEERSIVSKTPGTTRDYVSETLAIKGVLFKILDTAGIRETSNEIEKKGIHRTYSVAQNAFFKILVINPFNPERGEINVLKDLRPDYIIFTHKDLPGWSGQVSKYKKVCPEIETIQSLSLFLGPMGPDGGGPIGPEIEELKGAIYKKYSKLHEKKPILIERHSRLIRSIYEKSKAFEKIMNNIGDVGILSSELSLLDREIEELLGIISPDEVLSDIFANFCIGK